MANFTDQIISFIKGEDAEQIAKRIQRRGVSNVKTQISLAESEIVTALDAVEDKKEGFKKAMANDGNHITDNAGYTKNLKKAWEEIKNAKLEVESLRETLAFWKEILKEME